MDSARLTTTPFRLSAGLNICSREISTDVTHLFLLLLRHISRAALRQRQSLASFGPPPMSANYTGQIIFERLNVNVGPVFISNAVGVDSTARTRPSLPAGR